LARLAEHVQRRKGIAMKLFAGLTVAGALLSCAPAMAEDIDLSSWTCKQFLAAGKEDVGVILAWLDGYYKEEDEPPVINTEALVTNAKKLGQYCAEHPDSDLISATDKLFQKE
jgi:acid stress chaperone HdeB